MAPTSSWRLYSCRPSAFSSPPLILQTANHQVCREIPNNQQSPEEKKTSKKKQHTHGCDLDPETDPWIQPVTIKHCIPSLPTPSCSYTLLKNSDVPNRINSQLTFPTHSKWVSSISYKPVRTPESKLHPTNTLAYMHTHTPLKENDSNLTALSFRTRALPFGAALRPPQAPQHLLHRCTIR